MAKALNATGAEVMYSINNAGGENVADWGPAIAQTWTNAANYTNVKPTSENIWASIRASFLTNINFYAKAGPGSWNNPGPLMIGW